MRTSCGSGFLLVLLLASGAKAQQIPPIQEVVDVTVANVDVVVTDRAGNRVRGLTREDFELFEEGVPQRIANFAEFDEGAGPLEIRVEGEPPDLRPTGAQHEAPAVQRRRVIIFWDLSTTAVLRGRELGAAIQALLDDLGPGDEVMIVSWHHGLTVEVPSTPDLELAREGVRRIVKRAVLDDFTKKSPCGDAIWRKRELQLLLENHRQSALVLRALLTRVAPTRGRKVLVLVSEGFGAQPGAEILACIEMPEIAEEGSKLQEPGKSETDNVRRLDAKTSRSLDPLAEGDRGLREAEDLFESLLRAASAAGVTLYAVHSAGLIRPSLDPIAVENLVEPKWAFVRRTNSMAGLRRLAVETGGVLAANTNDFIGAFHEISADLGSYYSIGYRVADPKREGDRRIEIRMRNPELTARTRRAVSVRSPDVEVSDATLASLELGEAANDLAISAVPMPVIKPKRGRFSIPIEVRIPLEPLSFAQEGNSFTANVSIFVAATDATKASTEVERLDHRIEIAADDFPRIAGTYYTYRLSIDLRGRSAENRVAIGVLDQLSKITGFTIVKVGGPASAS